MADSWPSFAYHSRLVVVYTAKSLKVNANVFTSCCRYQIVKCIAKKNSLFVFNRVKVARGWSWLMPGTDVERN